jgi:uncharacterized protein YndB with AHSA1/START domain
MRTVRVEKTIQAPIEQVFDLLTDHANYKQFRGIRDSELLREGEPAPNGVGALRRVDVGRLRFEEEITHYESPVRMDYLIRRINAPLEHEGGSIRLEPTDQGTRAEWTSTFRVTARGVGGLVTGVAATSIRRGFTRVLDDTDRILTSPS